MDRNEIAQALMPALLAELFANGMPESNVNIFQLAAARAYLGADALIERSHVPPIPQPAPEKRKPIDLAGALFPSKDAAP